MNADNRALLIYGAGHLGRQTLNTLRAHYRSHSVQAFVDDTLDPGTPVAHGVSTIGGLDAVKEADYPVDSFAFVFAIGYSNMRARRAAFDRLQGSGYGLLNVIHPRAIIEPSATIGTGTIILAGAIIDQGASVEDGCYVDIGVRVGEDATLGRLSYASSGAALGGAVTVGENCFLGMDCTITTGVSVGDDCFINAKSLVSRNLGSNLKLVEVHKSRELPNG